MQQFRGGLVLKAQRLLHHSTLGSRVIKQKKRGPSHRAHSRARWCSASSACANPATPSPPPAAGAYPTLPYPMVALSSGWSTFHHEAGGADGVAERTNGSKNGRRIVFEEPGADLFVARVLWRGDEALHEGVPRRLPPACAFLVQGKIYLCVYIYIYIYIYSYVNLSIYIYTYIHIYIYISIYKYAFLNTPETFAGKVSGVVMKRFCRVCHDGCHLRAPCAFTGANLRPTAATLRHMGADLRPMEANLRLLGANLRPLQENAPL